MPLNRNRGRLRYRVRYMAYDDECHAEYLTSTLVDAWSRQHAEELFEEGGGDRDSIVSITNVDRIQLLNELSARHLHIELSGH